jgi:hypothetical protein
MAKVRRGVPQTARNIEKRKKKAKRKAKKRRQRRHQRQIEQINIGRAARNPDAPPKARGCLAVHFWKRFKLSAHLAQVGILKDGLPLGHILLVVMLFGLLNATSLADVAKQIDEDRVLRAILDIEQLEVKQVYRGLAMLTVEDYQAWMGSFVRELQLDARTASRGEGVLIGDGTQVRRSHSQRRGKKCRWLRVIFLHSEKRFDFGFDVESTHYADREKDYPLLSAIYEPSPEQEAEKEAARERKEMGLDLRRTADQITWLKHQVTHGEKPEWVELGGRELTARMRAVVEDLKVPWVGVSGMGRKYCLKKRSKSKSAKSLLKTKHSKKWLDLPDWGYQICWLGAATCTAGEVVLLIVEHMASGDRQLYVLPPQTKEEAITQVTRVLEHDQEKKQGHLNLMLTLVKQSLQAGILAATGVFDRGYLSPKFILELLELGLKRVIIPAKKGFHHIVDGIVYALPELWKLLTDDDFQTVTEGDRTYQIASRQAGINGLGQIQLVFVRQFSRRHHKIFRSFILICTDIHFKPADVLRAYLLRWKIEVGYREVKQNHAFGRTLSTSLEVVYGQLVLSFLAYTCLSVTRLLTARLRDKTLGWIKRKYFNAIVELRIAPSGAVTVLFPPWLFDSYGLPDYCPLC